MHREVKCFDQHHMNEQELAPGPVFLAVLTLCVTRIGTKGGLKCIQRTWLLLGELLGSMVQKEEEICDDKKGGGKDFKLNEKALLAKSKIQQTGK